MTKEEFDFEDAIYQLGVLLSDDFNGLLISTLKKNFYEEYKQFDTMTAWDCFVDEVNRVNTVCELHDYLVDNLEKLNEINELSVIAMKYKALEKENRQLKESVYSWSKSYNRVYEEKEQLQQQIKELEKFKHFIFKSLNHIYEDKE